MLSSNIGQRGGQHQEDLHGRCDDFQQAVSTWSVVRAASVRDGRVELGACPKRVDDGQLGPLVAKACRAVRVERDGSLLSWWRIYSG